jgi:hypothetical protein
MNRNVQKAIALFFVVVFFILALIPAFYPVEDDVLRPDCPFCKTYNQLFSVLTSPSAVDHEISWGKPFVDLGYSLILPQVLLSPSESRAPPA